MPGFLISPTGFAPVGGSTPTAWGQEEFYYTYTWEIIDLFEDFENGPIARPIVYLKDLTMPTFTGNTDSYLGASIEYKWAKSIVWEDVKVSWYDTKGLINVIKRWRERVWNSTDGLRQSDDYKRESQLDVHLPTWNDADAVKWRLYNSWPKIIKHGDLTYTNSDVKLVEVTVAYDWAEENDGA
jgi:hypothetical protein